MWARMQSWKSRLLSQARKAIMIQAVGQSILLYAMSCFKLPRGFVHELNMMFAGYWLGDIGAKRRIHWKRLELLCCSKLDGGLGFKDLASFNMALLVKQWWRVTQDENSLCFKVLRANYFLKVEANLAEKGQKASYLDRKSVV